MKFAYHLYQLRYKHDYGTVSHTASREGALIQVAFDDGIAGYCDCHPWVELGDQPLPKQLELLKSFDMTPLLNCSLDFARLDAEARHDHKDLFAGLEIPPSHQIVSLSEDLENYLAEGITYFKLKTGVAPEKEMSILSKWSEKYPEIKLRLDFNEKFSRSDFHDFWEKMTPQLKGQIDFLEDPYAYDPQTWSQDQNDLHVSLAADRFARQALFYPRSANYLIHKPAVEQSPENVPETTKLVITTYLDHPFGQMCAAYKAAKLKQQYPNQVVHCGLLSHKAYEDDPFINQIHSKGPYLIPSVGTGFGFDTTLGEIKWQSL